MLLALAATIGLLFDSLLVSSGWITYPAGQWHPMLAPYWIVTMWIAFATTLNVSLGWLRGHSALAFFFGALGGPLSFLAGAKLGAATFINQPAALATLAIGWAVMMPFLMALAAQLHSWQPGARWWRWATAAETQGRV